MAAAPVVQVSHLSVAATLFLPDYTNREISAEYL